MFEQLLTWFTSPLDVSMGLLGSLFLFMAATLCLIYYYKTRLSRIFLYMSIAECFLWIFVSCLFIASVATTSVPVSVVVLVRQLGLVSSRVGLLTWFILFQLLGTSEQRVSRLSLFGGLVILLGFSAGFDIVTTEQEVQNGRWIIKYDPMGVILLVLTYGSFVAYQMIMYYKWFFREKQAERKTAPTSRSFAERTRYHVLFHGYFVVYGLAILSFVLARIEGTLVPATTWILFGGLSQLLLTIAAMKHPRALLLSNLHFYELGIYSASDGLTTFHLSSQGDTDSDFLTVALRGMESVISRLIGAREPMTSLGFGDRSIILYKLRARYFYAIVNDPNYVARDLMRSLANKWRSLLENDSSIEHSDFLHQRDAESFIKDLRLIIK